ncbi:Os05g0135300, partial [Oryza sativa Japonica Group]
LEVELHDAVEAPRRRGALGARADAERGVHGGVDLRVEAGGEGGAVGAADGVGAGEGDHVVGGEVLGGEAGDELGEVERPGGQVGERLGRARDAAVEAAGGHGKLDPAHDARRVARRERDDVGAGDHARAAPLHDALGAVDDAEAAQAGEVGRRHLLHRAVARRVGVEQHRRYH